ncbi:MAG: PrsW family glutamic-type intramembrane protease [Spirochaetota bacterium]
MTTLPAAAFLYILGRHLRTRQPGLFGAGAGAGIVALPLVLAVLFLLRRVLPNSLEPSLFPLVVIPLLEEGGKLTAVRNADRRVAPDDLTLLVPLGLLVGCVFGYLENLFYLWERPGTSLLRGISSLPLHMAATGAAALVLAKRPLWRGMATAVALVAATTLHMAHNALWNLRQPMVVLAIVLAWGGLIVTVSLYLRLDSS